MAAARWPARASAAAPGLATLAALIASALLFLAAHRAYPARPVPGVPGTGWWGWSDQGHYLAAAQALARGDLSQAQQHYEPGYPALAAPFLHVTPTDPFLLPDLASLLLAGWLFGGIGARLLGPAWGRPAAMAVFLLATVGAPRASATWVVPWTTTAAAPLLLGALLATLRFMDRPRPGPGFLAMLASGALAAVRPGDAVATALPCAALASWALIRRWPGRRAAAAIVATGFAGTACGLGPGVALHAAIWGSHPSPYMTETSTYGFNLGLLPLRWVLIVVGPQPLTGGRGLAVAFPWIVSGVAGMAACLASPGQEGRAPHLLLAVAAAASLGQFLSYRDLHPAGIWTFDNLHYFKWLLPVAALYTLALAQRLVTPGPRARALMAGAAAVVAGFCWRPELHPVPAGAVPATVTAPNRLTLANGLPSLRDAILVAADAPQVDLYVARYAAESPARTYHSTFDFKAYPRPGGFLLIPLRPIGPDVTFAFPAGIALAPDIPAIPVRQALRFVPPCWLARCSAPDLAGQLVARLPSAANGSN